MAGTPTETVAARRLNELRLAHPADETLRNLLAVVGAKLDLCARLPIYEYETTTRADEAGASVLRRLASVERQSVKDALLFLRRHLEEHEAHCSHGATE